MTPSPESAEDAEAQKKQFRDPLHGVTLETMLNKLVGRHGWTGLAERIAIRCFQFEPSVKSSLKFLRKTPWARKKVEDWYAYDARRGLLESKEEGKAKNDDLKDSVDARS